MNRRDVLTGSGALLGAAVLPGCSWSQGGNGAGPIPIHSSLIDAHCHVFNGSDLPTVRFLKIVVLENYPKQAIRTLDIRDPDAVDGLLALFTFIVGRTAAPTAQHEIAVLDATQKPLEINARAASNETAVIDAIAAFASRDSAAAATSSGISPKAVDAILDSLFSAAGETAAATAAGAAPQLQKAAAERAFRSKADIGVYLRWFALFTRYRHSLAEDLAATHERQGFRALMVCPALIDYDYWLGENVDRSPLPMQVQVLGRLARRKTGPVVHGYVGFDPLRQAYFASGKPAKFEPLALVRKAIREEGFLGVKLYPPMGFKPFANEVDECQTYDQWIVRDLGGGESPTAASLSCDSPPAVGSRTVGRKLDQAMAAVFDLCEAEDACVLAHANETNAAGPGYARRADPAHWLPVFQRWPRLRICLAHFGHFSNRSAGAQASQRPPEDSWEWVLGDYIHRSGDPPVFADVSYMNEVFAQDPASQKRHLDAMKLWVAHFDPDCRHLVFGTDWTMLGMEASYETYTKSVFAFFKDQCGFDQARLDRLFYRNAGRFLGLGDDDGARKRLLHFYTRHGIPASRLPRLT